MADEQRALTAGELVEMLTKVDPATPVWIDHGFGHHEGPCIMATTESVLDARTEDGVLTRVILLNPA